jgi:hypothetical protein
LGRNLLTAVITAPTTPRAWQVSDVNGARVFIIPKSSIGVAALPPFVFQIPRSEEAIAHVLHGKQATWPFLKRISAFSIVERATAECCSRFDSPAPAAPPNASDGAFPDLRVFNAALHAQHIPREEAGASTQPSCWSLGADDDVAPHFAALETRAVRKHRAP